MKKFLLLLIASILALNASAQSYLESNAGIVFKGGYNFLEKQPTTTVALYGDFAFVRVGFSMDYVFSQNKDYRPVRMPLFSPALGVSYGYRNVAYLMFGAKPFGILNKETNKMLSKDKFRFSIESGCDISLNSLMFINLSLQYLLPAKETELERPYQSLMLMAGFGFYI